MEARGSLKCTSLCVMRCLYMNIFAFVTSICHEGNLIIWYCHYKQAGCPSPCQKVTMHTTHSTWHILSAKSLHVAAHGTTWVPHLCMQQHMAKLWVSHACTQHTARHHLSGASLHLTNGTWHSMSAAFIRTSNSTWHSLNSAFAYIYMWHNLNASFLYTVYSTWYRWSATCLHK